MINYIIQIVFFQVVFLAVYDLFLRKETFFKWNRLYLLITPILSFVIPLLKFESIKNSVSQEYIVLLPEVVLNPQTLIEQTNNSEQTFSFITILGFIGIGFFFGVFVVKLSKIIKLIVSNSVLKKENYKLILLEGNQTAFSFFNYIFVGKSLYEKEELQIIQHELVHSKQYHSLDLLFFEILKILMWFNPMVYIYQKRITLLHEYISDAEVIKETNKKEYFNTLLKETFKVENISFINQFYKHSLIKKRIIMISKDKSLKVRRLKYLLLIPILGSMLFYISCTSVQDETQIEIIEKSNLSTVQIETSDDKKSGYIKTSKGIYFYKKNEDGSVLFFDDFGGLIDISTITDSDISFSSDGKRIDVKAKDGITSGAEILENIPFHIVDKVPQFPGCSGDNETLKDCLNKAIREHVGENFNIKALHHTELSGKQKIFVKFKITKNGTVVIGKIVAPSSKLEDEARRVVNSLPKMIPGKYGGKEVNVNYVLTIVFDIKK